MLRAHFRASALAGSTTSFRSFQYLQSVHSNSLAGFLTFLLYDQGRQQIYVTNIDQVEVFSLQQNIFLPAILPPIGLAPNVGLRGLALTPGDSQLVVADFGAQNVYFLDPAKGTGTTVPVGGIPGFAASIFSTRIQALFDCAFSLRSNSSPRSTASTATFLPSTKMASGSSPSLPLTARLNTPR